jgi:hypothetical protein
MRKIVFCFVLPKQVRDKFCFLHSAFYIFFLGLGILTLSLGTCNAQGVGISSSSITPDDKSILEIQSTSQGILLPRMSTTDRDAITAPIPNSLLIFNTTTNCFEAYYETGAVWVAFGCIGCAVPTAVTASAAPNPICEGSSLTLTGVSTGASDWSWTGPNGYTSSLQSPAIAGITIAGAGVYTLTASNSCGSVIANTALVTVTALSVSTFSYTGTPYCSSAIDPSPTFSGGGIAGTFSSTAGLVFVSTATGQVDLAASTAGTYTVTNTIAATGGCGEVISTSLITITTLPVATFSYPDTPYCSSATDPSPTYSGGGVAGTYTSTAGLAFVSIATGEVDLSASTAGIYTVTNTIAAAGGCGIVTATSPITVVATTTTANAGSDINPACDITTATLAGNNPIVGTGAWTVVSGTATITTPSSNTSGVTGLTPGTAATLRWTISNSPCTSTDDVVITTTVCCGPGTLSSCGNTFQVSHCTSGGVAPVDKTVTYGTVTTSLSGVSKCWITQNLGADNQAGSAIDATDAAAGWYWQFNRKQGYKVGPTPAWSITAIDEGSDWLVANDPCTIELGAGWRIPTETEWFNADATGAWVNYTDTYNSALKLHTAGYLDSSDGSLGGRGTEGHYCSSTQVYATKGWGLYFFSTNSIMKFYTKATGYSVRCLRD